VIARHEPRVRAEHESLDAYLRGVLTSEQLARPLLVSFTQWDFAVGAVAETVTTLMSMGADVSLALWSDETPVRDVGWQVNHLIARAFRSPSIDQRLREALIAAGLPGRAFAAVDRRWSPSSPLPAISGTSRLQIRGLTYRGAPMGRGILEVPPHPDVPVTDDYHWPRRYVEEAARSYAFVYDHAVRIMQERKTTCMFSYNGRFLHDSAVVAAAEAHGLPVLAYDTGGLDTDFDLTIDATHDWSALQRRMKAMYAAWPAPARDEIGGAWFIDRAEHAEAANEKFTGEQVLGRGIERDPHEVTVTYFSSSGDEIAELDLDWADYFGGQEGAVLAVAEACRALGYRFVIRTHPHKRFKPRRDVQDWHAAVSRAAPDLHLDEHSDVDSYTLMRQSDVVVTYGSSTGVEAGFAERPVIVMGPSAYDELGCAVRVRTAAELKSALVERRHGHQKDAIPYGLMMKRRGFSYAFVDRMADGTRSLADVAIIEPHIMVRHLSHFLNRLRTRRYLKGE
jgi:hypothetical protein